MYPPHSKLGFEPISAFTEDLGLAGPVMDNIQRACYKKPTPVQKHALPIGTDDCDFAALDSLQRCIRREVSWVIAKQAF